MSRHFLRSTSGAKPANDNNPFPYRVNYACPLLCRTVYLIKTTDNCYMKYRPFYEHPSIEKSVTIFENETKIDLHYVRVVHNVIFAGRVVGSESPRGHPGGGSLRVQCGGSESWGCLGVWW